MKAELHSSGNIIICDLDGTLLNNNSEITPYSLEILKRVSQNNIVIYASGRKIERILSKFPNGKILGDYAITQHGARIFDIKSNLQVIEEHKLDKNKFIEIYNLIRENGFQDEIVPDQNYNIKWNVANAPECFYLMNIGKNSIYHNEISNLMQRVADIEFFEMFDSNSDKVMQLGNRILYNYKVSRTDLLELTGKTNLARFRKAKYSEIVKSNNAYTSCVFEYNIDKKTFKFLWKQFHLGRNGYK